MRGVRLAALFQHGGLRLADAFSVSRSTSRSTAKSKIKTTVSLGAASTSASSGSRSSRRVKSASASESALTVRNWNEVEYVAKQRVEQEGEQQLDELLPKESDATSFLGADAAAPSDGAPQPEVVDVHHHFHTHHYLLHDQADDNSDGKNAEVEDPNLSTSEPMTTTTTKKAEGFRVVMICIVGVGLVDVILAVLIGIQCCKPRRRGGASSNNRGRGGGGNTNNQKQRDPIPNVARPGRSLGFGAAYTLDEADFENYVPGRDEDTVIGGSFRGSTQVVASSQLMSNSTQVGLMSGRKDQSLPQELQVVQSGESVNQSVFLHSASVDAGMAAVTQSATHMPSGQSSGTNYPPSGEVVPQSSQSGIYNMTSSTSSMTQSNINATIDPRSSLTRSYGPDVVASMPHKTALASNAPGGSNNTTGAGEHQDGSPSGRSSRGGILASTGSVQEQAPDNNSRSRGQILASSGSSGKTTAPPRTSAAEAMNNYKSKVKATATSPSHGPGTTSVSTYQFDELPLGRSGLTSAEPQSLGGASSTNNDSAPDSGGSKKSKKKQSAMPRREGEASNLPFGFDTAGLSNNYIWEKRAS